MVGQKVLYENHKIDLTKSKKLSHLRLGPFTVTKQITATTYEIQEDKNHDNKRNVHRNQLIEYYPKSETLSPLRTVHYLTLNPPHFMKILQFTLFMTIITLRNCDPNMDTKI